MTKRFLAPLSTDHVDFNLTNPSQDAEGRLRWNTDEGTLNLGMGGGVVQQIGEEFFVSKVLNNSGVEIPNGAFVMATGAQGDQITIAKAVTNGTVDPKFMLGFATKVIPVGSNTGRVTMYGVVRDMNTGAWPVGTVLYPNPQVAGGLTATEPQAPNVRTPIAIVIRQHANTGRIYVRMTNGSTLGGTDSNVKFENLQAGDTITYNAASGIWVNAQPTGGSAGYVSNTEPAYPSEGTVWVNPSEEDPNYPAYPTVIYSPTEPSGLTVADVGTIWVDENYPSAIETVVPAVLYQSTPPTLTQADIGYVWIDSDENIVEYNMNDYQKVADALNPFMLAGM